MSKLRPTEKAFTLIELLVVVAIVAILTAILIPSLSRARQQAFQVRCAAHLRGIGVGIIYYALDRTNGNGYLPQLSTAEMVRQHAGFFWTNQVLPYMKVKRSKAGSRDGFFRCPSDREPVYRFMNGDKAGQVATIQDKLLADVGRGPGGATRRHSATRRNRTGDSRSMRIMVEPLSYAGSCDTLVNERWPGTSYDRTPRKMTALERPHCQALMADTLDNVGRCWTWDQIMNEAGSGNAAAARSYRRHYGGNDPNRNGSNWLFADGHVSWYSVTYTITKMICCQDLGYESPKYSRMNASRAVQMTTCPSFQRGRATRRRSRG